MRWTLTQEERFWSHVDRTGPCWEWKAYRDRDGYGRFLFEGQAGFLAHRASYTMAYGQIGDGMLVLHRCDNPSCVRPDHLFLGSATDNHRDKASKGRCRNGWATNPEHMRQVAGVCRRKMTDEALQLARELKLSGVSQRQIAKQLNVSEMTVSRALRGHLRYAREARA